MSSDHQFVTKQTSGTATETAAILRALSRYSYLLLLLLVVSVIAGLEIFVMFDMRKADVEAEQMYAGSVLGFRNIGELQYQAQETRRSTLYALTTNDSNLQLEYADQSRDADQRVRSGIEKYLNQARLPREIQVGTRLRDDWSAYLKIRDEVLASILEGSTKEAVDLDVKGGVVSFDRVRQDLDAINALYDEESSQQLGTVDETSKRSLVRLVAVITLTVLFACVSIWAIQRSRLMTTIQLARLQMDFVASVSHELRTPLSVIRSAAENICDGVIENTDQLQRYGSILRNQTRQISDLVNQILLFASSRHRKQTYLLSRLQVSCIIDAVAENTSELLQEEGFVLERHIQPALPEVVADAAALSQCLQNLVVNAIKYSGKSRWIGIYASRHPGDGTIRISVKDRGIGIAHSELKQVFEPFYRSPSVCAAQIHGTGLGLPLARNIAESLGGGLSVTSELGVGSVFTIRIPAAEQSKMRVEVAAPASNMLDAHQ